ncbi:MAG: hypothetical protein HC848_10615, partial [Limnobacter sp.]|nr:hypothetical protein [Limnobacter sp.]
MVSQQLATLDNSRVSVMLTGLMHNPVQMDIQPDQEHNADNKEEQEGPAV